MKEVNILIDGKQFIAYEGETLLDVARRNNIDIPALCYDPSLKPYGACRLCIVEVIDGAKKGITTSCTLSCVDGLSVRTDTEEIKQHRKILFELYLAQAPASKKLKKLAARYGVFSTRFKEKFIENDPLDNSCVMCGLCVRVCNEVMGAGVINFIGRGHKSKVNTPYLEASQICLGCQACVEVCPTGAIKAFDEENVRYMASWSQTTVKLKKCAECGRYFAPEPLTRKTESAYFYADKDEVLKDLCPDCRRKYITKKVTQF